MITRIVKMSFNNNDCDAFVNLFNTNKHKIIGFKGCTHLKLHQDLHHKNIFFTYSYWQSETDLNNYRQSDVFKNIWTHTKRLFNNKPEAWTVNTLASLK